MLSLNKIMLPYQPTKVTTVGNPNLFYLVCKLNCMATNRVTYYSTFTHTCGESLLGEDNAQLIQFVV